MAKSRHQWSAGRRLTVYVLVIVALAAALWVGRTGAAPDLTPSIREIFPSAVSFEDQGEVTSVFDDDGRFIRQVTLLGEGDPRSDHYYFLGDRLFVARRAMGALDAMFKRDRPGLEEDGPEPMAVICYRLDL